jgi:hypothetical protein
MRIGRLRLSADGGDGFRQREAGQEQGGGVQRVEEVERGAEHRPNVRAADVGGARAAVAHAFSLVGVGVGEAAAVRRRGPPPRGDSGEHLFLIAAVAGGVAAVAAQK